MRNSKVVPGLRGITPRSGMTLVEMLVSIGVGFLILASVATIFTTASKSFAALSNYINMDMSSRSSLDLMTRNIRAATNLVSFASDKIVLALNGQDYLGTLGLTYSLSDSGQLIEERTTTTGGSTNVLLANCDWLQFSLYDRTLASTTDPTQGKVISVAWRCSRQIMGKKVNTEDIQQSQIVIRNQ